MAEKEKESEKERGMTAREFVTWAGITITIVGAGITAWTNERIHTARLEERIISMENKNERLEKTVMRIFDKLEEINEKVSEKADRK